MCCPINSVLRLKVATYTKEKHLMYGLVLSLLKHSGTTCAMRTQKI